MVETHSQKIDAREPHSFRAGPFPTSPKVEMARFTKSQNLYPYFHPISGMVGPKVTMNGRETIMLGSNNYLGLADHPLMIRAAKDAIDTYGTGCTGSRFLNGTLDLHNRLETNLARFIGKDAGICFSTGMQANLGVISGIAAKGDFIVSDSKNHGSIVDGCRLSYAETRVYKHDTMEDLERVLKGLPEQGNRWIISDGVFSMEGSVCNLPEIVELAEQYDARIIIDDAHAVGYLGEKGRGTGEHFKLMDKIDLLVGTFSKSFASIGGFVTGSQDLIDHLRHHARSLIFSASIPPAAAATALKALELFKDDSLRTQLVKNTKQFRTGIEVAGFNTLPGITPITPIVVGDIMRLFKFNQALLEAGVYVNPVVPPATPTAMVRTSLMSSHTSEHIKDALEIMERVGRDQRVLKWKK